MRLPEARSSAERLRIPAVAHAEAAKRTPAHSTKQKYAEFLNLRAFFISFLFAYNGGLLSLILPPGASIHTFQLVVAIIGGLISIKARESCKRLWKNFLPISFFLLFIGYFLFHQSRLVPVYSRYKALLLLWSFAAAIVFVLSIDSLRLLKKVILFGIIQIIVGVIAEGLDLSSFREGAGEPIVTGRLGAILICFSLFFSAKDLQLIRLASGLFGLIFILLSGTRTLILSVGILFLIMFFLSPGAKLKKKRRQRTIIFVSAAFGALLVFIILAFNPLGINPDLISRYTDFFTCARETFVYDQAVTERRILWRAAIDVWKTSPILGIGLGGFADYVRGTDMRVYPHNMFLEVLAEGGLIGSALFCFYLFQTSIILRKSRLNSPPYIHNFLLSLFIMGILTGLTSLEISNQFVLFLAVNLTMAMNGSIAVAALPVRGGERKQQRLSFPHVPENKSNVKNA